MKLHKDFIEVSGNEIIIGVKAVPKKGKANEKIIEKLSKYFSVPKSSVRIISGASLRKKIVEIV